MKLKRHSYDDLNKNIKDICLELTDNGFFYYLDHFDYSYGSIEIRKGKDFKWSEIEDVVERLKDYLIPMGYYWKYDARKNGGNYVLFKDDDIWMYIFYWQLEK